MIREDWIKAHTRAMHDPKILRLTWAQRGVWWHLLLLSKSYSELKGFFFTDAAPMSPADIALAMHSHNDHEDEEIADALRACVAARLLEYSPTNGYEILNWNKWQAGIAKEDPDKVRARKRKQRAAERPPNISSIGGAR